MLVDVRGRVPQHVALRGTHQQPPLAHTETRLRTDAVEIRLHLRDDRLIPLIGQLRHRGPPLPGGWHPLPLVHTDVATVRRLLGIGLMRTTRRADPHRHTYLQKFDSCDVDGATCDYTYSSATSGISVLAVLLIHSRRTYVARTSS